MAISRIWETIGVKVRFPSQKQLPQVACRRAGISAWILAFPEVARKKKRPIREEIGRSNARERVAQTSINYQLLVISDSAVDLTGC
jgi:hypothetical protein